jgi:dihydroorotase
MDKILIKNGLVYDPVSKEKSRRDIAVTEGRLVNPAFMESDIIIDAEGCLVFPGLIDAHAHVFSENSDVAVDADSFCLPNGVTSCVDAGTSGTANFESCFHHIIGRSSTRILTLLDVTPAGQATSFHPENQDPKVWNRDGIRILVKKYPDNIVGLKLRLSKAFLDPFGLRLEPLYEARKLGDELALPLVVHVQDPGVEMEEIASVLRKGDVFCHMYAGDDDSILDDNGSVKQCLWEAKKRGVVFDACNGRKNFLFKEAVPALKAGFCPDFISTDVNKLCHYKSTVISFPRLLSKYIALGMDLYDVIDCATVNPARWLGNEDLATLRDGTVADIAVFKVKNKPVRFFDYKENSIDGDKILVAQLTVKAGTIVYCQSDFQT